MNLLEMLETYQGLLQREGKNVAVQWLNGVADNVALVHEIIDCFDDKGRPVDGLDQNPRQFSFE